MPCSYIVLLSWVCFWIEADCVGDRISIGVTLVLTIVLLQGSLNANIPKVTVPQRSIEYLPIVNNLRKEARYNAYYLNISLTMIAREYIVVHETVVK